MEFTFDERSKDIAQHTIERGVGKEQQMLAQFDERRASERQARGRERGGRTKRREERAEATAHDGQRVRIAQRIAHRTPLDARRRQAQQRRRRRARITGSLAYRHRRPRRQQHALALARLPRLTGMQLDKLAQISTRLIATPFSARTPHTIGKKHTFDNRLASALVSSAFFSSSSTSVDGVAAFRTLNTGAQTLEQQRTKRCKGSWQMDERGATRGRGESKAALGSRGGRRERGRVAQRCAARRGAVWRAESLRRGRIVARRQRRQYAHCHH
jgi:hypothetical protein